MTCNLWIFVLTLVYYCFMTNGYLMQVIWSLTISLALNIFLSISQDLIKTYLVKTRLSCFGAKTNWLVLLLLLHHSFFYNWPILLKIYMIHDMDQNAFWSKKILPLKILGQTNFKSKKMLGQKLLGQKNAGPKNKVKKIWVYKKFGSKKIGS